jgi:S1-C subfamily serine protease
VVEVVRGGRAGLVLPLTGEIVTVGRGPDCQLRLHPEVDLEASARHLAFIRRGDAWVLCDLGSRNGTFLNGTALAGEAALHDGDTIGLGTGGPALRFRATTPAAVPAPGGSAREPRGHVPTVLAALAGLVILVGAAVLYADRREQRAWERDRAGLQLRLDSLRLENERTETRLRGQVIGLAQALQGSRGNVERLRGKLVRADSAGDRAAAAAVGQELRAAGTTLQRQQVAASLDFAAIQRANRRATAVLYIEYDDGSVAMATAFVVSPDGVMLTNRHAVLGATGSRRPRRLAIQFAESAQVWPARLLATHDSADLAAVRVENIEGAIPTVRGLNLRADTLRPGAPVALIGFPLGGDEPTHAPGSRAAVVRPILGAGVLRSVSADRLEIEGYGAEGASGSPIFDATGEVVGILYGGREGPGGQSLYAVPAALAARLLGAIGVSSR